MSEYALTVEEAMARLVVVEDYDPGGEEGPGPCVHTFRESPFAMLGAHWRIADAKAAMEKYGVAEAGPQATAAGHGVVVIDDNGPVFFEARRWYDREASNQESSPKEDRA